MRVTTAVLAALPLAQALLVTRPPTASHAAGMKRPLSTHAATTTVAGGAEAVTQQEVRGEEGVQLFVSSTQLHHFHTAYTMPSD